MVELLVTEDVVVRDLLPADAALLLRLFVAPGAAGPVFPDEEDLAESHLAVAAAETVLDQHTLSPPLS